MAASPQQKFETGVAKVCSLRTSALATTDLVSDAWSSLRTGVLVVRGQDEVLDSRTEDEMNCVLEFAVQRACQKRSARVQVRECLRILLARQPWSATACADARLCIGVRDALDAEQDAELIAQLRAEEAEPETAAEAVGEESEEAVVRPAEPEETTRPPSIPERLARGRSVLQRFGWEFPRDPTGTRGDEATAGFMLIFEAVTALTTTSGRASVGNEPAVAMACLEEDWADLLRFLVSMYSSGVRRTYSLRIRFVVVHLRAMAPAFKELAPWASLPWGHLPVPADEAEDAESLRLASQPQAQEEVEAEPSGLGEFGVWPAANVGEQLEPTVELHGQEGEEEEQDILPEESPAGAAAVARPGKAGWRQLPSRWLRIRRRAAAAGA